MLAVWAFNTERGQRMFSWPVPHRTNCGHGIKLSAAEQQKLPGQGSIPTGSRGFCPASGCISQRLISLTTLYIYGVVGTVFVHRHGAGANQRSALKVNVYRTEYFNNKRLQCMCKVTIFRYTKQRLKSQRGLPVKQLLPAIKLWSIKVHLFMLSRT